MLRVVQGLSATLSHTFQVDGVATNPSPDAATVTIIRADGTILVNAASATDAGTGVVTYTLTPAQTAVLDTLTVDWTAVFGGQAQVFTDLVEVAGGVLFTVAQARATRPLDNAVEYSTAQIVEARTLAETALEEACSVAFVPRYAQRVLSGDGSSSIMLSPRLRAVRDVLIDGASVGATAVTALTFAPDGTVYNPAGWPTGVGNITVAYEHGYTSPPPRVSQAALMLAKVWLVKGPIDDRMTSFSTDAGTFALSTPGLRGAEFGIPEVDAVVHRYDMGVMIA